MDAVRMVYPETGGEAVVDRRSFERVWSKKGWKLVEDEKKKRSTRSKSTIDESAETGGEE